MPKLSLIHFNDVYRVTPQKLKSGSPETIDVTQFAALVDDLRDAWKKESKEGLVLFSGDAFSPSVESSVTRGSHMVPVLNEIAPDVSLTGNHEFDFGYPHLTKLLQGSTFPWLLSNIIDSSTSKVPEFLHEYKVFERAGVRIGVIGLVEEDWIGTVSGWPSTFEFVDMVKAGQDLSRRLRDPNGDEKCDIIIALTHSRLPTDINLAKDLFALSASSQASLPIAETHGVDILLGGHDHAYFVSKGVDSWEGYDTTQGTLGAEDDNGDILLVKSGTDFRELSAIELDLVDVAPGENVVRNKLIQKITGKRLATQPGYRSSTKVKSLLTSILSSLNASLKGSVAKSEVELDLRSDFIRLGEAASGNWFADILRHTYDDALCMKSGGGADAVFITAGTLRGDSIYGPGTITIGDILGILPFEDPLVVIEVDGATIWAALESGLEAWPAQEGRFPVISGFRVTWDSRRPPGQRVLSVLLESELADSLSSIQTEGALVGQGFDAEIKRETGGKKYKLVTRQYIATGHDGYTMLDGSKYLIDDESGQMMSSVVRKYLLGSRFVNRMTRLVDTSKHNPFIQSETEAIIQREKTRQHRSENKAQMRWRQAASHAINVARSKRHYQDTMAIAQKEHMSDVDHFNGGKMRRGSVSVGQVQEDDDDDLLVIHPIIDGRMKDAGRA